MLSIALHLICTRSKVIHLIHARTIFTIVLDENLGGILYDVNIVIGCANVSIKNLLTFKFGIVNDADIYRHQTIAGELENTHYTIVVRRS